MKNKILFIFSYPFLVVYTNLIRFKNKEWK